jgi:integrase
MLRAQWAATKVLGQRQGRLIRQVFHRDGQAIKSFRHAWQAAVTRARLPGRLPHDLRRTAVRNLVRAGVSEKVVRTLTGHQTRAVFDRYDLINEADLRSAVERRATRRPDDGLGQVLPTKRKAALASP